MNFDKVWCQKCQKFGHNKFACRSNSKCGRCGDQDHDKETCSKNIKYCTNCDTQDHESVDRRCPTYKKLCTIEEETETNLILTNSPNSYDHKKRLRLLPEEINNHSKSFVKKAGFSNEITMLQNEVSQVTAAVNNINKNLNINQESLLNNIPQLIKSSFDDLQT